MNHSDEVYAAQGANTVADYHVKISPAWGAAAECARDGLTARHRLAAAGAESPEVFTSRLKHGSPFFKRFNGICEATASAAPVHPFELAYFTALTSRITLSLSDVALALRADAGEHGGRYPARLDDLVPAYLDTVPRDPFDGAPLRYDPVRPAVWSIGPDGNDDAGTVEGVSPRLLRHKGDIVSTPPAHFARPPHPAR